MTTGDWINKFMAVLIYTGLLAFLLRIQFAYILENLTSSVTKNFLRETGKNLHQFREKVAKLSRSNRLECI